MDEHKINYHIEEYGSLRFAFDKLDDAACWTLRERLATALRLKETAASVAFEVDVDRSLNLRSKHDAEEQGFSLADVLAEFAIVPLATCLVAFSFQVIYRFQTTDVVKYFDDIWYPGPDDINILDESLSWMVAVYHHGSIKAARFDLTDQH